MKTFLLSTIIFVSIISVSSASTICSFYCVKTESGVSGANLIPTLFKSESNELSQVLGTEAMAHCEEMNEGSHPIGNFIIHPDGSYDVNSMSADLHTHKANCISL
ncbi:MAG: hypothetical protein HOE90_23895 [Bacteriovoracaceae bacterium]|jgi:hypothetical protein|nr:hypothetical protein [Bacteriovoracaceae bacterium]